MVLKYIVRLMANGRWVKAVQCDTEEEVNIVIQVASESTDVWYEKYMVEVRQCEKDQDIKYGMPIHWETDVIYHTQNNTHKK